MIDTRLNPYIYTFQFAVNGRTYIMTNACAHRNIERAIKQCAQEYGAAPSTIALLNFYDATKDEEVQDTKRNEAKK